MRKLRELISEVIFYILLDAGIKAWADQSEEEA
jgi:hypothetical protein